MEDERFKRLFWLEDNLYVDAAPVIIEKGSLLLDKQTNTLLIQLKFHSLSVKKIKALTIRISTYYASGEKHPETVEYQYLDLLVEYGTRFGEKKAILLKDTVIRSFSIDSYSVVYEDKTVEEVKGALKPLPVSKELQEEWINLELQKQYRMETTEEAKYIPIRYQNLWRCTCGEWNLRDTCSVCQSEKEKIFGKLNVQNLTAAMDDRLKKEEEEREEQRKREEEEAQRQEAIRQEEEIKRKRLLKKVRRIAAPVILVGIFAFGIYPSVIKPGMEYKHAKELLSEEKFDDSIETFEALGDYKDSAAMITEARCLKAKNLLDKKEYDAAKEIYEDLGKEDDVKTATQMQAEDLIGEGKCKEAVELLAEFDDKKSKKLIAEASYEYGILLMEQEDYAVAIKYFEKSGDYKDATSKVREANYERGIQLIEQKKYLVAIGYLKKAEDYEDAISKIGECKYLIGLEYMNEGDYDAALDDFEAVKDYDNGEVLKKAEEKISEIEEQKKYTVDFTYSELNDGSVKGKIEFEGKVIQVFDAENDSMYLRVELNSNKDEIVLVTCKKDILNDWEIDDKIITVYGSTSGGKFTYEAKIGTVTLPWVPAESIEIQ